MTCPKCGKKLELHVEAISQYTTELFYKCDRCGYRRSRGMQEHPTEEF
jgi:uncharacterized Zn finger protein